MWNCDNCEPPPPPSSCNTPSAPSAVQKSNLPTGPQRTPPLPHHQALEWIQALPWFFARIFYKRKRWGIRTLNHLFFYTLFLGWYIAPPPPKKKKDICFNKSWKDISPISLSFFLGPPKRVGSKHKSPVRTMPVWTNHSPTQNKITNNFFQVPHTHVGFPDITVCFLNSVKVDFYLLVRSPQRHLCLFGNSTVVGLSTERVVSSGSCVGTFF